MASDWSDWADGTDLADMSRSTDPLTRAGYDPDDVRANPQLRQQVMQQAASPYGLQSMLRATGPVTPAPNMPAATARPVTSAAPQNGVGGTTRAPRTAATMPTVSRPATAAPTAVNPPSATSTPQSGTQLDELGRQALEKGLSLGNFASGNAQALVTADPGTEALEAQEAKDATPTPYLDPATGKVLPSAEQYKPTGWQKFERGAKGAALGFLEGGPFGAGIGAIDPGMVRGGTGYDTPNKAYQATEAAREQRLGSDQQQIADAGARFKEMTDARKAANIAAGTAATAYGDVGRGVVGMQPKPKAGEEGKPQNMLVNGQPALVTWDGQKGWLNASPGPSFGQPVQGTVAEPLKQPTTDKPVQGTINGRPAWAIPSPQGWLDGRVGPNYGKPLPPNEAFAPPPSFAETGMYEPTPVYDPNAQNFEPGSFNKRTGQTTVAPMHGNAAITVPPQAMRAIDTAREAAREADTRLRVMTENEKDALDGNQQAMISLVANHIGMTLGQQKGARINQAVWEEAVNSAPWLQRAKARFGKDGVLEGVTLSPDQIKQMVGLAQQRRDLQWQQAQETASQYGIPIQVPQQTGPGGTPQGNGAQQPSGGSSGASWFTQHPKAQ